MGKLVRDKVPNLIQAEGREASVRQLGAEEFELALRAKLVEEATEVQRATLAELLFELADVLEVVHFLADLNGFAMKDIEMARKRKKQTHGAFSRRYFLQ